MVRALRPLSFLAALLGAALGAGCAGPAGAPLQDTVSYTVENTPKFVLLDEETRATVACTGLQEHALSDGRLEVIANVKNRSDRRLDLQIQCVFRDRLGFSTGDETPWQTLLLDENATEDVRFTALNPSAHRYTLRVREAR